MSRRWSLRVRLTVLFGGLFVIAATVMLALTYLLVDQKDESPLTTMVRQSVSGPGFSGVGPVIDLPDGTQVKAGDVAGFVAQREVEARDETVRQFVLQGTAALVGVSALAIVAAWLLSGRSLAPLQQITATARRIGSAPSGEGLHERIALEGPHDEVRELADTFDAMVARLDAAFGGQRRFVANASHELRTPLAINRTVLEVAASAPDADPRLVQVASTLLAVNARHERLIDGLLTLVESENGLEVRETVDLAEVCETVLGTRNLTGEGSSVRIDTYLAPAVVLGDGLLLERLVQNLVDNALRHNLPAGGWVRVATETVAFGTASVGKTSVGKTSAGTASVGTASSAMPARTAKAGTAKAGTAKAGTAKAGTAPTGTVRLVVSNSGVVVPGYEVDGLFEPFRRLRRERTAPDTDGEAAGGGGAGIPRGAGIGLSIVRAVAVAHGGSVSAAPLSEGGLAVTVVLPGAPAVPPRDHG